MSGYFARLAQRSGMSMPAVRPAAFAAPSQTSAPLEQDVESIAPNPPPSDMVPVRTSPERREETFPVAPPSLPERENRPRPYADDFVEPAIGVRLPEEHRVIAAEAASAPERGSEQGPSKPRSDRPSIQAQTGVHASPSNPRDAFEVSTLASTTEHAVRRAVPPPQAPGAARPRATPALADRIVPPSEMDFDGEEQILDLPRREAMQRTRPPQPRTIERPRAAKPGSEHFRETDAISRAGAPVEIRIGAITLEVRSPEPEARPAPRPQSTRSDGFAPHRHYLRSW